MIKRSIPKKLIPVENLTEDLNLGSAGIDVTSPPTKQDTVYDMTNLDVALDGGLSLRKPLFYNSTLQNQSSDVKSGYLFDDKRIEISKGIKSEVKFVNLDNQLDVKYAKKYVNIDDPTDIIYEDRVTYVDSQMLYIEGYGNLSLVTDRGDTINSSDIQIPNFSNVKIINTNTSTIIIGILFNLNATVLQHYAKQYELGKDFFRNRPVRIIKDESGVYTAEVMKIETSTIYTESDNTIRAPFNLMDDYIYSFKDNYDAGYVSASGVLVYTPKDVSTDINSSTVEELTESDKYILVDSITKNEINKKYILKALITNTVRNSNNYKIYCTWEKTYDNVTWTSVPEFLRKYGSNTIPLEITDSSVSYETLENSYKYTRTVQYTPFLEDGSGSNQDTLGNRPDVLVLDAADSATYRFSIRSVAITPPELGKKFKQGKYTIVSGVNTENGRTYIVVNNSTRKATIVFKFQLEFEGDVTGDVSNVHLTARTEYDGTGTTDYDYHKSFIGLDDDTLDSVFGSPLGWTYDSTTNTTSCNTSLSFSLEFTLTEGWLTQLLCLKFYLYEDSGEEPIQLWTDEPSRLFNAIVGYDRTGTNPISNPTFKYYTEDIEAMSHHTNITVVSNDSGHPDCYKSVFEGSSPNQWLIIRTIVQGYSNYERFIKCRSTDNVKNMYPTDRGIPSIELFLRIDETKSKKPIPISLLSHLTHSTDGIYKFDNFEYYLKNITLNCTIYAKTTVWTKAQGDFFGINSYDAFADVDVSLSNVNINLYDFLNLKNDLSVLSNAIRYTLNNIDITETLSNSPLTITADYRRGNYDMSDSDYNRIKNFYEAGPGFYPTDSEAWSRAYGTSLNKDVNGTVVSKVYTKYPLLAGYAECIMEDVSNMIDSNVLNTTKITNFTFKLPTNPFGITLDMLNNNNTFTYNATSLNMFEYDTTEEDWVYEGKSNTVLIESPSLSSLNITPESDTKRVPYLLVFHTYENNNTYYPFIYQYFRDNVGQRDVLIRLDDNFNILKTYDIVKIKDSPNVYNLDYNIRSEVSYADLGEVSSYLSVRYSKELASVPKNILFTSIKQIEDYGTINIYDSNKIYYNYRIWHYGKSLKNNIYFSNSDSINTPIDNCITLSTDTDDYVTALVPWRDYLIAATTKNIYLISKAEDSYVFKQINTFIGIPDADANTCKAILNGVIFKSGTNIYILRPNTYSSDETILNITDISKPISHHLIKGASNFAIATEYYYYVFIPRTTDTLVFKYEYTRKVWTKFTYPVVLTSAKLFNVGNILVTDNKNNIYDFDKTLDWYKEKLNVNYLKYGDYLDNTQTPTAIGFEVDSGQKSSAMQYTKQFTESKFIIATMEMKDTFPIETTIYVDGVNLIASHKYIAGNLQVITTDPNTDGAFSKTSPEDIGYLNTNIVNDSGETFNVIRQMILRYMGKGKTLRHVLKGESTFNFKIYVLYYRYRIPHNKQ